MASLSAVGFSPVAGGLRAASGGLFTPQLVQLGLTLVAAYLAPLRPALILLGAAGAALTAAARPSDGC
jgi:hypothetical protein